MSRSDRQCGTRRDPKIRMKLMPWDCRWLPLALLVVLAPCSAAAQSSASQQSSIQFANITAASGINFVHYRGNEGIPINREIYLIEEGKEQLVLQNIPRKATSYP